MKNKVRLRLFFRCTTIFVLAIGIFTAQLATLQHAIHHPLHEQTRLCDSFLSFEHHAAAIDLTVSPVFTLPEQQVFFHPIYFHSTQHYSLYAIRGPPVSYT